MQGVLHSLPAFALRASVRWFLPAVGAIAGYEALLLLENEGNTTITSFHWIQTWSGKSQISIGYSEETDMTEELERTEIEYTHSYDQCTVFFYGNHVFVGKKEHPLGQCCVDMMNLDGRC